MGLPAVFLKADNTDEVCDDADQTRWHKIVRELPTVLKKRPPMIFVTDDIPVKVTVNGAPITLDQGIANGVNGLVAGVQFPEGTTFTRQVYSLPWNEDLKFEYLLPSKQAMFINIRVANPRFEPFPGLDAGVYPIGMPPPVLVKCMFHGTIHSRKMRQFPIDMCIARTAHG